MAATTLPVRSYNGDRGLDHVRFGEIPPAPPSISHEALLQLGKKWVAAMGGELEGDESCGCEYKHTNWSGQIHYTLDIKGDEGQQRATGSGHTAFQACDSHSEGRVWERPPATPKSRTTA